MNFIVTKRLNAAFDFIAVPRFGKSGSAADLYEKYGLPANEIIKKHNLTVK